MIFLLNRIDYFYIKMNRINLKIINNKTFKEIISFNIFFVFLAYRTLNQKNVIDIIFIKNKDN